MSISCTHLWSEGYWPSVSQSHQWTCPSQECHSLLIVHHLLEEPLCLRVRVCVRACVGVHVCACIPTRVRLCVFTCVCWCVCICVNVYSKLLKHISFVFQTNTGDARTQSPPTKNCAPESPTFGEIASFNSAKCNAWVSTWRNRLIDHGILCAR